MTDSLVTKPPVRRILVFEYLHAQSEVYAAAPSSMRSEGRAMLLAVSRDFAALPGVVVCVAVCDSAAAVLPPISNVELIVVEGDTESSLTDAVLKHGPFDEIFPIAPESDNVFANLVQSFREHGQPVIAPSAETIEIGSNKWQLCELLEKHRLPTIPTRRISQAASTDAWQEVADELKLSPDDECVIKPIDGAGCEEIERCRVADVATRLRECPTSEKMIIQPNVVGESFSVGIIGCGKNVPPLVLPVAVQNIQWHNRSPTYRGGSILTTVPADTQSQVEDLVKRLLQVVSVDRGYVGIDLIRSTQQIDHQWVIMEINPRLCTSYVGYREATTLNLAGKLLGNCGEETAEWSTEPTAFSCESGDNPGYN